MKSPEFTDRERCISLRVKSRQGQFLRAEDADFVSKMFDEFPDWYKETERRVFNDSAPFGAKLQQ